ncbi:MAG: hypothetical protein K2F63_05515, partial [Muribaculaceae bacterium]|nr:hypothetical protein [Muribaculaceae bacterium]
MKKTLILLCVLMLTAWTSAMAQIVCVGDIYYNLSGGKAYINYRPDQVPYTGHMIIPSTIEYDGITYDVALKDPGILNEVEEITFGPGFQAGMFRLSSSDALPNLERINIGTFNDPSSEAFFQIGYGGPGKTISAQAYYESPEKSVVEFNRFNVYGP